MRKTRARVISTETVRAAHPRRRTRGRQRRRLRATAAALAGGLALALAGCSGDDGPGAEQPAASRSPEASTAEQGESAHEPSPVPTSVAELNARVMAAQVAAGSGHLELAYSGPGIEEAGMAGAGAAADVIFGADGAASALRVTVDVVEQALEFLVVDGTLYVSLGQEAPGMWVSMSREEMAADPAMAPMLPMIEGFDPAAAARTVEGAVTHFEHRAGDGVDVFTATLDPSRIDPASLGLPGLGEQMLARIESMTSEVTVAQADGLPTQTVSTTTVDGVDVGVTVTYSQWGQVAPITAPPADKVVPYTEVHQQ